MAGLGYWIFGSAPAPTQTAGECKQKETFDITAADHTLGKADAPITVVEYASMTCPHCARFTTDVFPQFKKDYIDTGHVRYVFREFPLDRVALAASVAGRCLAHDAYIPYVEMMYGEIQNWATAQDPRAAIKEMARRAGMSGEDFEKCMSTEDDAKKIVAIQKVAVDDYCINGTPTFFMNGKKLASGEISYSELDEKLRAELKAKGVALPAAPASETTPAAAPADGTATQPAAGATPTASPAPAATPGTSPAAPAPAAAPGATPPAPAAPAPATPAAGGTPH